MSQMRMPSSSISIVDGDNRWSISGCKSSNLFIKEIEIPKFITPANRLLVLKVLDNEMVRKESKNKLGHIRKGTD